MGQNFRAQSVGKTEITHKVQIGKIPRGVAYGYDMLLLQLQNLFCNFNSIFRTELQ